MEGLLKEQVFDNLFKLHASFKMFKSLLLKEDGDGASRTSTGKEFQRSSVYVQYCRVPKNGQAGISPKNNNDPGWRNEFRTIHHTQRVFAVKTTSSAALLTSKRLHFDGLKRFSRIPAQHASSHTVCALQANLCDSKTD